MPETPTTPSTPNPEIIVLIGSLLRTFFAFGAGYGMAWAQGVSGDQIMLLASTLALLMTQGWSWVQKWMAARREHQIAVMSAKGGKAVQPEKVTP